MQLDGTRCWCGRHGCLNSVVRVQELLVQAGLHDEEAAAELVVTDADGVLLRMGVGTSMSLLATLRGAVARGIELELALAATTRNVAKLYRMHDRGEIAVGKRADLLVVNHDLEVDLVIAGGRILVRDGEPLVRGPFEARP